jgi:anti-sigma factor RsiW
MNCIEIADLLPEYIRRRLPAEEAAIVRAHLSTCAACAAAYEAELAFQHALGGLDAAPPAQLLPQIMASVRVQPQHKPAFHLRPLDLVYALAAAFALYGLFIAGQALWFVFPFVADALNLRALFDDALRTALILAAIFSVVGLAISIPVAALVQNATNRTREPYPS